MYTVVRIIYVADEMKENAGRDVGDGKKRAFPIQFNAEFRLLMFGEAY